MSDTGQLVRLDTPTKDGVPHEGTMWRVELAVDRRHYQCASNAGDPNIPTTWPPITQHVVDGQRCWRCLACSGLWTTDQHWAEPDYRVAPSSDTSKSGDDRG